MTAALGACSERALRLQRAARVLRETVVFVAHNYLSHGPMLTSRTGSERQPLPPLSLDDPELYAAQIRRLGARRERDRWLFPSDAIAGALDGHPHEIAARLARDIPREGYSFSPLAPHAALLNGKPRVIYRVDALDAVVWSAYARALSRAIDPRLGDHLYSYRAGRSQFVAADDCVRFLREHVTARPDPRTRGVFVLRRDIRRYDEAIAVSDDSALWTTLAELVVGTPFGEGGAAARLLESAFRPPIQQADGTVAPLSRGMPTGIPTQTIACNAYLIPVDRELSAIPGAFYARFGDDLLFAHADLATARGAAAQLERGLERLGLSLNQAKSRDFFLTGVGRSCPDAPEFAPVRRLPYLGLDLAFDGARLRTDKRRQLLRDLFARIDNAVAQVGDAPFDERANTIARIAQTVLDPKHVLGHRYTTWLRVRSITRSDLIELDRLIALHCAQRLTGKRGVRAFRAAPPRRWYTRYGLPSLVVSWEQARHRGRTGS